MVENKRVLPLKTFRVHAPLPVFYLTRLGANGSSSYASESLVACERYPSLSQALGSKEKKIFTQPLAT